MKSHQEPPKKQCDVCDKIFRYNYDLKRHKATHFRTASLLKNGEFQRKEASLVEKQIDVYPEYPNYTEVEVSLTDHTYCKTFSPNDSKVVVNCMVDANTYTSHKQDSSFEIYRAKDQPVESVQDIYVEVVDTADIHQNRDDSGFAVDVLGAEVVFALDGNVSAPFEGPDECVTDFVEGISGDVIDDVGNAGSSVSVDGIDGSKENQMEKSGKY